MLTINIAICVVFLAAAAYCDHRWRHRPTYLHGWWHYQSGGPGFKWQPRAWADACDQSLQKSLERRHHDDNH